MSQGKLPHAIGFSVSSKHPYSDSMFLLLASLSGIVMMSSVPVCHPDDSALLASWLRKHIYIFGIAVKMNS